MAIVRNEENFDNSINYVATLAFFCAVTCVTLMLKFRGFKASLNIFNGKRNSRDHDVVESGLCLTGAYRTNRDEFYGSGRVSDPPKKFTPSMVKLPVREQAQTVRPAKSTSDLTTANNASANLRKSTPNVSSDPRGENDFGISKSSKQNRKDKNQEKEQKLLEKKRIAEQKAREKQATQEQAKQEKLRKEKEKKDAQANVKKDKRKAPAPQPQLQPKLQPQRQPQAQPQRANPLPPASIQYSTNTLESSISRSSGPPPYNDVPKPELVRNKNDASGNVSFSKPVDPGSWDMIAHHRQQITRTTNTKETSVKQMTMDLNYNFNTSSTAIGERDNSEA